MISALVALTLLASVEDEYFFDLLLRQHAVAATFEWEDYEEQHKKGWPNGGVLFVTQPNCRPCDAFELLFDELIIVEKWSPYVVCKTPAEHWKTWADPKNPKLTPPFLVNIEPGGEMVQWVACPSALKDQDKALEFLLSLLPEEE